MNEVESDQECQCLVFFSMYCQSMYLFTRGHHSHKEYNARRGILEVDVVDTVDEVFSQTAIFNSIPAVVDRQKCVRPERTERNPSMLMFHKGGKMIFRFTWKYPMFARVSLCSIGKISSQVNNLFRLVILLFFIT